jgi:uncharacterized membrane protein
MGSFLVGFGIWILTFYYQIPHPSVLIFLLGDCFVILGIGLIIFAVTTFKKASRRRDRISPENQQAISSP